MGAGGEPRQNQSHASALLPLLPPSYWIPPLLHPLSSPFLPLPHSLWLLSPPSLTYHLLPFPLQPMVPLPVFLTPEPLFTFPPSLFHPQDNLTSATLPRNYKVSPLANDRRSDVGSYRRSLGSAGPSGTLPRSWQPVSRIPMPPSSPQPRSAPRQRPIPLSMIFKLQNAFWEQGASRAMHPGSPVFSRAPPPKLPPQPQAPPQPQLHPQPQPQLLPPPQPPAQVPQPPQQTWPPVSEGKLAVRGWWGCPRVLGKGRTNVWEPDQLGEPSQPSTYFQTLSLQRSRPDELGNLLRS